MSFTEFLPQIFITSHGSLRCCLSYQGYYFEFNFHENLSFLLTGGKDEFCGGIPLQHNLNLTDACKDVEYTNYVAGFHGKLDHVFIQKDHLVVERMVPMSTHEEVTQHVALPNEVFPSDHMPLVCDIRWL